MPREGGDGFIPPSASLIDVYYAGGDALGTAMFFLNPLIAFGEEFYHGIHHKDDSIDNFLKDLDKRTNEKIQAYKIAEKLEEAEKTRGTVGKPLSYSQLKDIAKINGNAYIVNGGKNYWMYSEDWNKKNRNGVKNMPPRKYTKYRSIREFPLNSVDPESFEETEDKVTIKFQNKKGG